MTIRTLAAKRRGALERNEHRELVPMHGLVPMSNRARVANREWYPALKSMAPEARASTCERTADRPLQNRDAAGQTDTTPPPIGVARRDERQEWARANREWYPGLCSICEKLEGCTYPQPEGGVFHCEEYE